jgi:hypothetical protein
MNLINLKEASYYEVEKWLIENIPDLTPYQKSKITDNYGEFIRFSPFKFFKLIKLQKPDVWWRLTIIPFGIVFLLLIVSLPIKMLFTGTWVYEYKDIEWFINWGQKINIKL